MRKSRQVVFPQISYSLGHFGTDWRLSLSGLFTRLQPFSRHLHPTSFISDEFNFHKIVVEFHFCHYLQFYVFLASFNFF